MGRLLALSLVLGCAVDHTGLSVTQDAGDDTTRLDVGGDTRIEDIGAPDTPFADVGVPDTRVRDVGSDDVGEDVGLEDGGFDAGPPDTGPPDAGPPDTGPPDTGPPDTGPPDTGPPDTGPPDAGPDAGTPEVCNGIDDDSDGDVDESGCPSFCTPRTSPAGRAYLFCASALNWWQAEGDSRGCQSVGYGLVSIETEPEQEWLTGAANDVLTGNNTWWIGLNDRGLFSEGTYTWVSTGSGASHRNFAPGEPNDGGGILASEDCVLMRDDGRWNDLGCSSDRFFICEYQP